MSGLIPQLPQAMGGKGSGRKSSPKDQAVLKRVRDSGAIDPPPAVVNRAKAGGIRAIRRINKNRNGGQS